MKPTEKKCSTHQSSLFRTDSIAQILQHDSAAAQTEKKATKLE